MFAFILHRLIQAAIVLVAVAFIAFLLFQYVGDRVVFLLGQDARPDQIQQLRTDLGLDQPFFVQFWHFCLNAALARVLPGLFAYQTLIVAHPKPTAEFLLQKAYPVVSSK